MYAADWPEQVTTNELSLSKQMSFYFLINIDMRHDYKFKSDKAASRPQNNYDDSFYLASILLGVAYEV